MELWERSADLASLIELLEDRSGVGRVALIAGEAGIGKSALVAAFVARARGRARVLWGACDPLMTPRALGPLHDIGAQTGGALAAGLSAGSDQNALFAAVVDDLSGPQPRPRPVVVLEDVHWADEGTLDLLVFLARRIDRLNALLVVTYRDDEVGVEHPLREALAALPRQVVRRMALAPLSKACVVERAVRAGLDPAALFQVTGGNPLLVTEVLALGELAVPATVRDLILARLRRLPVPAQEVARLVAAIPTRAELVLFGDAADEVDQCLAAGVLIADGEHVAYRHDLLRRAVEDSISPVRRAALHRRVLTRLAGVASVDPARLVHHAYLAGDGAAVLRYGRAAAASAAVQGAHREAAAHYRTVLPHADRLPAVERAEMLEAYAFQAYLAGQSSAGLGAQRQALAERERLDDRERVGENLRWISRLAWWSGRGEEARTAAAQAVAVLAGGQPGRELAMAYSNRSQLHMLADEIAEALVWGELARELADRLGDRETSLHASINLGSARLLAGEAGAGRLLERAHDAAAAAGFVDHAARALVNLASTLVRAGEHATAAPVLDEALRYVSVHDLDGYLQYLSGVRAEIEFERCRWDAALAAAEESLARPNRIGVAVVPALVTRGRIQSARGDDSALATLDLAADHAYRIGELQWIGPVANARSEYFLLAGDPRRAAAEARQGLDEARPKRHAEHVGALAYRLWLAGAWTGPPPPSASAPYRRLMTGRWTEAAAAWAGQGRAYARVAALSAGDAPAVAEALGVLDGLDATRAARWLRGELRRRGMPRVPRGPRPTTAANPAGLTSRQQEVLTLLAEGLSNADIAARLTLSAKTVEHHVSAVLAKLEVASRGQAVAAARRLDLLR